MSEAGYWLIAALALAIAELAIPGVFLIFLAIAAAITGAAMVALPGLSLPFQLLSFAVWSIVAVVIGRRWYRDFPVSADDVRLNDRVGAMIGQMVTVETAIVDGHGRVAVGDGAWPARGPDAQQGQAVRILGIAGGVVLVEPIGSARAPSDNSPTRSA